MKKTISVNIKGMNFIIEEDAYQLLQNYLDKLKKHFGSDPSQSETLDDIELRIAELCSSNLTENKSVIELSDIEQIIQTMGKPEDYYEESDDNVKAAPESEPVIEKRLFRDSRRAAIAGVCAGIANYLNIDVVIVRAVFVLMFLTVGFGIPLYIILWIIIPRAKSSIDRLRMRGRPINVDTVRSEVEEAAQNISNGGKRFAREVSREQHYTKTISKGARIFVQLVGIALVAIGLLFLIPFIIFIVGGFGIIPIDGEPALLSFPEFGELILSTSSDYRLMWIGVLLIGFSVILFFVLSGSFLLFRIKNIWTKITLFGLILAGFTGFILVASIGLNTGEDYYFGGDVKTDIGTFSGEKLQIMPLNGDPKKSVQGKTTLSSDAPGILTLRKGHIHSSGIDFHFLPSSDSLFHISQQKSARGRSESASLDRAMNIQHQAALSNDTLYITNQFRYPESDKLRAQSVIFIIQIPQGSSVSFDDRVIKLGKKPAGQATLDSGEYEVKGRMKADGRFKVWD